MPLDRVASAARRRTPNNDDSLGCGGRMAETETDCAVVLDLGDDEADRDPVLH
jgi:hypothetical protein